MEITCVVIRANEHVLRCHSLNRARLEIHVQARTSQGMSGQLLDLRAWSLIAPQRGSRDLLSAPWELNVQQER